MPALVLGVLGFRAATKQKIIIQQQEAELRQKDTDALASDIRNELAAEQKQFVEAVDTLLAKEQPGALASHFASALSGVWPRKSIGFAVTVSGRILSPTGPTAAEPVVRRFLEDNAPFLGNKVAAEVYQTTPRDDVAKNELALKKDASDLQADASNAAAVPSKSKPQTKALEQQFAVKSKQSTVYRNVAPQNAFPKDNTQAVSQLNVENSRFSELIAGQHDGVLSRFVQNELKVVFWMRPAGSEDIVFGAEIEPREFTSTLAALLPQGRTASSYSPTPNTCLALLDDRGAPVVRSDAKFTTDWKRPFVASEIGEVLPHWEAALYLIDPEALTRSARLVSLSLTSVIALALAAILFGGYLVVADTRRQLAIAQKKADFVSNVSHELKTPLTSIRMFADLLRERRVTDPEKTAQYLRIITLESERLTRLINNVLDFAKIERNQKRYDRQFIDFHPVIEKIWEGHATHLNAEGFQTVWHASDPPYPVYGDADALAQVLVNLLSNAEKYCGETREVELRTHVIDSALVISVLDRGLGVPRGEESKIFEEFYRAHDSLSSGIQGSGLGLTLARRIAEEHGGTIRVEHRKGGGSIFSFQIPLARQNTG